MAMTARDHLVVGNTVPKEWATLTEGQRRVGSLQPQRVSRAGFLGEYGVFVCNAENCGVCLFEGRSHT